MAAQMAWDNPDCLKTYGKQRMYQEYANKDIILSCVWVKDNMSFLKEMKIQSLGTSLRRIAKLEVHDTPLKQLESCSCVCC